MNRLAARMGFVAALGTAVAPALRVRHALPESHAQGVAIDTTIELASFDSAWRRVRDTYYDSTMHGLDWNRVRDQYRPLVAKARTREDVRAAITKMFDTLGDSHFGVIPGDQVSSNESASSADASADIGADVRFIGDDLVVSRLDSGGPAMRAGVRTGWIIDVVDSVTVASRRPLLHAGATARDRRRDGLRVLLGFMRRLRGAPGSTARVIMRDGQNHRVEKNVVRQSSPGTVVRLGDLPPMLARLEQERVGIGPRCIGVIRFNTWMAAVAQPFDDAMDSLRSCRGIVLDLRGNVGGIGAMIVGITGHFTDRDLLLGVMHSRTSVLRFTANPRRVARNGTPVTPFAGPLALVVDELSASTTEIFVSALQQYGRARVFGDTTAGQALPSVLFKLPNGDVMMHPLADLTDPSGRRLEGSGVVPNERHPLTRSALLAGRDDALAEAIRWAGTQGSKAGTGGGR